MIRLLAIKAATEPASVEFHTHQVVNTFQTSMAVNVSKKKKRLFSTTSAKYSIGMKAINTKPVSGDSGHEAQSRVPDKTLRPNNL